jgi:hypothetical protein
VLRRSALALALLLLTAGGASADDSTGATFLSPADDTTYPGPSATIPLDFHADCTSDGTKYVVAAAYDDQDKSVASTGTVFKLDGKLTLTLTIDNDSWVEQFTIKLFLNCGKEYGQKDELTVTLMDGKLQARRAQQYWEGIVATIKQAMKGLGCKHTAGKREVQWACAADGLALAAADNAAQSYGEIADDPPDNRFRSVAKPKPIPVPHFTGPGAAAVNRFDQALARAGAYLGALVTSIDRTAAARKAGDQTALRAQRAAAAGFARNAAKTLRSLPALARSALAAGKRAPSGTAAGTIALHGSLTPYASASFTSVARASAAVLDAIAGS